MTVGIFLNVYILSNKLLEDFLTVLLSVCFTVTSCIYHLLEWSFYFIIFFFLIFEEFGAIPLFEKGLL